MFTLYNGDCLPYMKSLKDNAFDLVLTDPPYGINYINGGGRNPKNGWRDFRSGGDWDTWKPTQEYFDEMLRVGKVVIIWGGNYFANLLPPSQQWLVWDKGQRDFSLADGELAWSSQNMAVRIFTYPRAAMLKENGYHPTQKPVALMKWCIEIAKAQTVFDPFMGSGSTGVACMQMQVSFTGCELKDEYFSISDSRIKSAALQPPLFAPSNNRLRANAENYPAQQEIPFA